MWRGPEGTRGREKPEDPSCGAEEKEATILVAHEDPATRGTPTLQTREQIHSLDNNAHCAAPIFNHSNLF